MRWWLLAATAAAVLLGLLGFVVIEQEQLRHDAFVELAETKERVAELQDTLEASRADAADLEAQLQETLETSRRDVAELKSMLTLLAEQVVELGGEPVVVVEPEPEPEPVETVTVQPTPPQDSEPAQDDCEKRHPQTGECKDREVRNDDG